MKTTRTTVHGAAVLALLVISAANAQTISEWQAPDIEKLPNDKYGQMVRKGKLLMEQAYKYLGPEAQDPARRYAGNNLACTSCHIAAGTRRFGNPWAARSSAFRSTAAEAARPRSGPGCR